MSFYGSVYYQLIDTFYKIIVKNGGDNNFTFNENIFNPSATPPNEIQESAAIGRKGVFSLDSGNYWINFSKSEDVDEAAPYKIWHSAPHNDEETRMPIGGWDIETNMYTSVKDDKGREIQVLDQEGQEMIPGEHYVQLADHEFLRMYPSNHDEAGHIIGESTVPTLYRLPKSDVNERVDYLEALVGQPTIELPRWDIPEEQIEEGTVQDTTNSIMNLVDYAEKNYFDIKRLESYVGDWKTIIDYWGEAFAGDGVDGEVPDGKYSIRDVIGSVQTMFDDQENSEDYAEYRDHRKSFSEIIGKLPQMWRKIDSSGQPTFISFADAIIKIITDAEEQKKATEAQFNTNDLTFSGIKAILGTNENNRGSVYTEIENLYTAIDETDTELRNELTAQMAAVRGEFSAADTALDKKFTDADATLQQNITAHTSAVNSALDAINGNINTINETHSKDKSDIWAAIGTTENPDDTTINGRLNSHNTRISTLEEDLGINDKEQNIVLRVGANETAISGLNTNLGTVSAKASELESKLNTVDSTVQGHVATIADINGAIANINTKIGTLENIDHTIYATEDSVSTLDQTVKSLSDKIGDTSSFTEGQTVVNLLSDLSREIEGIKESIKEIKLMINTQHPGSAEDGSDVPFPDVVEE